MRAIRLSFLHMLRFIRHDMMLFAAAAAFVVTVVLLPVFRLTDLSVAEIFFLALTGTLQGIIIALLIVTLSSNKLEGMAVTKLSALMILGAALPYFVPMPVGFLLAFLPSFWVGLAIHRGALVCMLPSICVAGIWILVLRMRFNKKN